jgi:DNA-binding NarL/FixJ family response regulator
MNCSKPLVTIRPDDKFAPELTRMEQKVLTMVARGSSNKEIASRTCTSVMRVKVIIHEICSKLRARSRIEAVVFAMMGGLLKPEKVFTINELAWFVSLSPQAEKATAQMLGLKLEQIDLPRHKDGASHRAVRSTAALTIREKEILGLVARGQTNKEIANQLYISTNTVKSSLSKSYAKLGSHGKLPALKAAMRGRILALDDAFSPSELEKLLFLLGPDAHDMIAQMISEGRTQCGISSRAKRRLHRFAIVNRC